MNLEQRIKNDIQKYHNFYEKKANAPIIMREFGFFTKERWQKEGHIKQGEDLNHLFDFDEMGIHYIRQLGWCEAPFEPPFEEKVLEDRGNYELVQDFAGRHVLYFKGRRNGFMPEYTDHPVKDMKTWVENVKWRLDPKTEFRYRQFDQMIPEIQKEVLRGKYLGEKVVGGYMYLRSLMGPEDVLYAFYDMPELIHECMEAWLSLTDQLIAYHQKYFDIDELFLAEDICYNVSSLISHDMIREFLFPYYQQLIQNIKSRNKNKSLHVQIDTDGAAHTVIDLYKEIGMTYMSPFEVASGCDVVELGKKYPDLLIRGGFDKRILSMGKEAIDKEVDRIMPIMYQRGGYIPSCDHGVPEEVSFENYAHFRNRLKEFAK